MIMLYRQPKTRKYNYTPRFFKEEEAGGVKQHRMQFRKNVYSRKKKRSYIGFILLLVLALIVIKVLNKTHIVNPKDVDFNDIENKNDEEVQRHIDAVPAGYDNLSTFVLPHQKNQNRYLVVAEVFKVEAQEKAVRGRR